jgi:hypothetical protein
MRGVSIVSCSANADRDEERNVVNPAGWPSTAASSPTSAPRVGLGLSKASRGLLSQKNTALGGTP